MFKSKQMLVRYAEETENRELLAKLALIETHGASSVADMCNDVIENATKNEIKFKSNMTRGNFAILGNVHKSKGLEFNTVFFVDFHDASWWGLRQAIKKSDDEKKIEEKNNFFVGLSRAKERLYFTKNQGEWPPIITDLLKNSKLIKKLPDIPLF